MDRPSLNAEWHKSACILCECNCGIEVQLGGDDGRRLVRLRGDKAHPASQGYACEKAHRLDHYQNEQARLTTPLRRRADGTFEAIDWQTAISEVAERLAAIRHAHGGGSLLYYGGGGQGNHLPGTYATATRRALGMRYRSNALAQEKTGEFWVSQRMLGAYTRGDFEHCEVGLFIGKNPWFSHGIPRARVLLKALASDPARTLIVVDPRRTKTAALADMHLQVKPSTDAWLLAAMVAVILEEDLVDHGFVEAHTDGLDAVRAALGAVDIAAYSAICGVPEEQIRAAARIIGRATSVASFEDLGVQMNRHSTLVSYLHRLLWLTTGNFGKPGCPFIPTALAPLATGGHKHDTPVTGQRIIGGLVPCNAIADEILNDHPARFRGMLVEAANPAHSLADSPRMREALAALDCLVVIDVALTETARLADYVLPASTQFEKAEATFFNFEFPHNVFHLRPRLLDPPEGPLPEAEIHCRLVEALGALDTSLVAELRTAAEAGFERYVQAFVAKVAMSPPQMPYAAALLYRSLGPTLPADRREGAVLLGLALRAAMARSKPLARAGFDGDPLTAATALFRAMLDQPSGVVFAVDTWDEQLARIGGGRIQLALPDLLDEARTLADGPAARDPAFPFVLSAGERRAFTANTIIRDPHWRRKDAEGALRISPADAEALGVTSGEQVKLTTARGSAVVSVEVNDGMQRGHISLPNGTGLHDDGDGPLGGIAPNELTASGDRDPFVGTPWHKSVPARLARI